MQVQATPHPPARTRPLAAVLDGSNAAPFGPHEPASYARGGTAAWASAYAIASRRTRERRTATAGTLATPASHAASAAQMDAPDVPFAAHPPVTGGDAVGPHRRAGLWWCSPVGRAAAVIRGVETRGPAPAAWGMADLLDESERHA